MRGRDDAVEVSDGAEDAHGRLPRSDPRNRNIFGKLLGHLHSAKSRLDSEITGPRHQREDGLRPEPRPRKQPQLPQTLSQALQQALPAGLDAPLPASRPSRRLESEVGPRHQRDDNGLRRSRLPQALQQALPPGLDAPLETRRSRLPQALQQALPPGLDAPLSERRRPLRLDTTGVEALLVPSKMEASQRRRARRFLRAQLADQTLRSARSHLRRREEQVAEAELASAPVVDRKRRRQQEVATPKRDPRSKNMFFKLLGHLHSAKKKLETDVGTKKRAKTKAQESKKAQQGSQGQEEFEEGEEVEAEEQALQVDKEIDEKEMAQLRRRLELHYTNMMGFIRTKAEPTIFYLPAKHTESTEASLEETRSALKHKITSLKAQLRTALPATVVSDRGEGGGDEEEPDAEYEGGSCDEEHEQGA